MTPISPIPDPPRMASLPWYGKERALPPYRFVPGLHPHPIRDPQGHSRRPVRAQIHPLWVPEEWPRIEAYLRGVDLFNRFYFWEAHEVWESLWKGRPPDADPPRFIQGLINIAASFLKVHMKEPKPAQNLWRAAANQLTRFADEAWMGIEIDPFLRDIQAYLDPLQIGVAPLLGSKTPSIRLEFRK